MYYNIKIKSKDSEFSLDSTNKDIMQKEMDIYFANIFDVSPEFRESIKKIVITNPQVKSIDEVSGASFNTALPEKNFKVPDKTPSPEPQTIPQFDFLSSAKPADKAWSLEEFDGLNFDNNFKTSEYNNINSVSKVTDSDSKNETTAGAEFQQITQNIDEIINLAQNELNSFDISTRPPIEEKNLNNTEELASLGLELEENSVVSNDSNTEYNDFLKFDDSAKKDVEFPQSLPSAYENLTPIGSDNLDMDKLNEITLISQTPVSPDAQTLQVITEIIEGSKKESVFNITPEKFLKENPNCELKDLFLFYSYYIKNTLQQDGFSLKVINAKLFHAIGKIADLSVADDLLSRGYIALSQTAEYKKYFITPCGEAYFAGKFQK